VIAVGDFNLTPWSAYYKDMSQAFSGKLVDVTKHFPILFTWRLFALPFLQAHIDHLLVSTGVIIDNLQSVTIPGSDHKGFLFDIKK